MKTKQEWIDEYNIFFKDLIVRQNKEIEDWVVKVMINAKDSYYNTGETIMDDGTYDRFEMHLKELNPKHEFLTVVGSK